jgi:hypothetical protein
MKRYVLAFLPALILLSCAQAPSLEERLKGKFGSEREKALYAACMERAHYPVPGGHGNSYLGHEWRLCAICDAMHQTNREEARHDPH